MVNVTVYWHNGKACENCVSSRALYENKAIVKIEYDQGRVFMINAFPVEVKGQKNRYRNVQKYGEWNY